MNNGLIAGQMYLEKFCACSYKNTESAASGSFPFTNPLE